jgi:hypothetical protein
MLRGGGGAQGSNDTVKSGFCLFVYSKQMTSSNAAYSLCSLQHVLADYIMTIIRWEMKNAFQLGKILKNEHQKTHTKKITIAYTPEVRPLEGEKTLFSSAKCLKMNIRKHIRKNYNHLYTRSKAPRGRKNAFHLGKMLKNEHKKHTHTYKTITTTTQVGSL